MFVMESIDIAVLSKLIRFLILISIADCSQSKPICSDVGSGVGGGGGNELGRVHVT